MLSANDVIEIFLNSNDKLQNTLDTYDLTFDDVGVLLYDEDKQEPQKIDNSEDNLPVAIWYNISKDRPHCVHVNLTHESIENRMREERLR